MKIYIWRGYVRETSHTESTELYVKLSVLKTKPVTARLMSQVFFFVFK